MAHKYCFEVLDRTLNDIMNTTNENGTVFSGKVIAFGGDFKQILPVILGETRSDIVHAIINSYYLWDHCHILTLTKKICVYHKLD